MFHLRSGTLTDTGTRLNDNGCNDVMGKHESYREIKFFEFYFLYIEKLHFSLHHYTIQRKGNKCSQ